MTFCLSLATLTYSSSIIYCRLFGMICSKPLFQYVQQHGRIFSVCNSSGRCWYLSRYIIDIAIFFDRDVERKRGSELSRDCHSVSLYVIRAYPPSIRRQRFARRLRYVEGGSVACLPSRAEINEV